MADTWLTAQEAAQRLGITVATLYDWLGQSNRGQFVLRGQTTTVDYLQGGRQGQGRIRIAEAEVQRLRDLLRVRPQRPVPRRPPTPAASYPGITVPLGRPDTPPTGTQGTAR